MARPVVIRTHYRDDAAYLLRLELAVLKDDKRTTEWRNKIAQQLRDLSLEFLSAEGPQVPVPVSSLPSKAASFEEKK